MKSGPFLCQLHNDTIYYHYGLRMKTSLTSVVCFLAAAGFGALGQYLYKIGADKAGGGIVSYVVNWRIAAGVGCYVAVMALFIAGFKQGGQMHVLYPVYATTFIWAALIARWAFATPITVVNIAGMVLLVGGMFLMGMQ